MSADEEARRVRVLARGSLPIRRVALADEQSPSVAHLDISERIAMVWSVTLDAWASSGRALPTYDRANMPGRVVRDGRRGG